MIDGAGRVVLPKHIRRNFHLSAGDHLGIEILPEGILLRTQAPPASLVKEGGLLVHGGEPADELTNTIARIRADRNADVVGWGR